MTKKVYIAPLILAGNGTISMTVSQLAELGVDDISSWEEFWDAAGDYCVYEDFDVNNTATWPEGFDLADDSTWDILTDEP